MDPVGMTNASASNVRKRNARMNATTTDSTVSRVASASGFFFGFGFTAGEAARPASSFMSIRSSRWGDSLDAEEAARLVITHGGVPLALPVLPGTTPEKALAEPVAHVEMRAKPPLAFRKFVAAIGILA